MKGSSGPRITGQCRQTTLEANNSDSQQQSAGLGFAPLDQATAEPGPGGLERAAGGDFFQLESSLCSAGACARTFTWLNDRRGPGHAALLLPVMITARPGRGSNRDCDDLTRPSRCISHETLRIPLSQRLTVRVVVLGPRDGRPGRAGEAPGREESAPCSPAPGLPGQQCQRVCPSFVVSVFSPSMHCSFSHSFQPIVFCAFFYTHHHHFC